jgi:hypothetical protein
MLVTMNPIGSTNVQEGQKGIGTFAVFEVKKELPAKSSKGETYAYEISYQHRDPIFAPRNHCSCLRTGRATGKGAATAAPG